MDVKAICLTTLVLAFSTTVAAQDWRLGIGTGISFLALSGDGGVDTVNGPFDFNARMKPNEVSEITESAFGISGFAEKDEWTINYLVGQIELQEDISVEQGGNTGDFDLTYTRAGAEVLVDYAFSNIDKTTWAVTGGIRYSSQEYKGDIVINGTQINDDSTKESWTDAVVGVVHDYSISPTTSWTTRVDANFGESDGFRIGSRINWILHEHWELRTFVDYRKIDFQEGERGDSDYFLYDAKEIRFGAFIYYVL